MEPIFIILLCVAGVAVLLFAVSYVVFRMAFRNDLKHRDGTYDVIRGGQYDPYYDKMLTLIKGAAEKPVTDEVRIRASDGRELYARCYDTGKQAPVAILCHGYKGNGIRDFSGGLTMCLENGNNVLLIDQRGHGKSHGNVIRFGVKERYDVADWVRYAANRFGKDTPVFLYGISMGAATVLMASELELPGNVVGIVADCPYSSPREIILKTAKERHFPAWFASPLLAFGARVYGGFDWRESDALSAVKNTKIPILLIHGEADRFVPCEMSRRIKAANPDGIRLETFPDAAHGISFILDSERYRRLGSGFCASCLGNRAER